jgi:hypothetical protein
LKNTEDKTRESVGRSKLEKQVFISYSNKDQDIALRICDLLEAHGITCWIAPRDVRLGHDFDEEIVEGIDSTRAFVLILSRNSNESPHVKRELEIGVKREHMIFPIRIENVLPSKKLEYYIATKQWVDAWDPPMEKKIEILVTTIKAYLSGLAQQEEKAPKPSSNKSETIPNGSNEKPKELPQQDIKAQCPKCEAVILPEMIFCSHCGHRIETKTPEFKKKIKNPKRATGNELGKFKIKTIVSVLTGIVCICLAGGFFAIKRDIFTPSLFSKKGETTLEHTFKKDLIVAGNEKAFGYIATDEKGDQYVVIQKGKDIITGKHYPMIYSFTVSDNGSHYGYIAALDKKKMTGFVVLDGKEGQRYDRIDQFYLSKNGAHFCYRASFGGEWINDFTYIKGKRVIMRDGVVSKYDIAGSLLMSTDGKHYTYWAGIGVTWKDDGTFFCGKQFVVYDGVAGENYDDASVPSMSTDGKHYVYWAGIGGTGKDDGTYFGGKQFIVYDGVAGEKYDNVSIPSLSTDGKHYVYSAGIGGTWNNGKYSGGKWFVIYDSMISEKYDYANTPSLSSDGKYYVYKAAIGGAWEENGNYTHGKQFVVLNSAASEKYDFAGTPSFSSDGKHHTYWAGIGGTWTDSGTYYGGKQFVVYDGVTGEKYDFVDRPSLSADGKRYIYNAGIGGTWKDDGTYYGGKEFIVYDGVTGEKYDGVWDLSSSKDCKHYVYKAGIGGTWKDGGVYYGGKHGYFAVIDGKRDTASYANMRNMRISGDTCVFESLQTDTSSTWVPIKIPLQTETTSETIISKDKKSKLYIYNLGTTSFLKVTANDE